MQAVPERPTTSTPTDLQCHDAHMIGRVGIHTAAGLAVHAAACALFAGLAFANLEGCDRGDGLAAAWGYAVFADLITTAAVLTWTLRRAAGRSRLVLAGWALSFVPAILVASVSLTYINSLPSGCP